VWTQQTKLVGTGARGPAGAGQGASVSLSGDGNTAIVGGPKDNDRPGAFPAGAAWVFGKPVFGGTPRKANCYGESVSTLAKHYGGVNNAAAALGFDSVGVLQDGCSGILRGVEDILGGSPLHSGRDWAGYRAIVDDRSSSDDSH
jgi:hypothetical protein